MRRAVTGQRRLGDILLGRLAGGTLVARPGRRTLLPLLSLLALLLPCAVAVAAEPVLQFCVDERPHPPYILSEREGSAQILVRMAAAEQGLTVEFRHAPLLRCIAEIQHDLAQGYPAASYAAAVRDFCIFPMRDHGPDPRRATGSARMAVFRRVGDRADWDGRHALNSTLPMLLPSGSVLVQERLRARDLPFDAGGKDLQANFSKLLAGRGDLVLGFENDGRDLMARAPFSGKIEQLPTPFFEEHYYLCLSKRYYAQHARQAQALWDAIGRLAGAPQYQAAIRGLK